MALYRGVVVWRPTPTRANVANNASKRVELDLPRQCQQIGGDCRRKLLIRVFV